MLIPSRDRSTSQGFCKLLLTLALVNLWVVPVSARTFEPERVASTAIAQKPAAPLCQAQLPNAIRSVINKPEYERVRWGIFVETLNRLPSARRTLFGLDENKLFTPASNNKLLTTAAALRTLGPNYRIRTSVYGDLTQPNPNLWVVGQGDPSLGTENNWRGNSSKRKFNRSTV